MAPKKTGDAPAKTPAPTLRAANPHARSTRAAFEAPINHEQLRNVANAGLDSICDRVTIRREPLVRSLLLVTTLALLLLSQPAQCAEPVYQGKGLSEWLLELDRSPSGKGAEDAIRQFGVTALPTLLDILGATRRNVRRTVAKLRSEELRKWYARDDADVADLRKMAVEGLAVLGTNAEPAVPQIAKLFRAPETSLQAASALVKVGPKGFAVLTNALHAGSTSSRASAIEALRERGMDPKIVDALLIPRLSDPDYLIRYNAAEYINGKDPAAIPPLLKMLDDDKDFVAVSGGADGLKKFGPAAKIAAPRLLNLYTNHVAVRDQLSARNWGVTLMLALKEIDQDAAAKAEAFLVQSGPLNYARYGHTVTPLKNGQELIVGGCIQTEIPVATNRYLSSAQLSDPATRKWKETAALKYAPNWHTATLLPNGKVLIAGGMDSKNHAVATAALYDPLAETWTETGSLAMPRFYHKATLRADGKVLVEKGHDGRSPVSIKELYDPTTERWTTNPQ